MQVISREKLQTVYQCQSCGSESPKWGGRCPLCNEWNTLIETPKRSSRKGSWINSSQSVSEELSKVQLQGSNRLNLDLGEVNRVLGGGLVKGSMVLIGGDPGIGKSTLLLQLSNSLAEKNKKVLYATGEESVHQIKLRADRLGITGEGIHIISNTELPYIMYQMDLLSPALVIIDSIQSISTDEVDSGPGTIAQVRECALFLLRWAKTKDTPVFITGHVTKEGNLAGPKSLEHMVDVVLYLEGENLGSYRLLRVEKNRFGSTNEIAIFEMKDKGLSEVLNPSEIALASRGNNSIGSVVVPIMEGSRPLLVEIQALSTPSYLPSPRRVANGVDFSRLLMIIAVMAKRSGFNFTHQDIIINVAGGFRAIEPAADLAIATALASSLNNIPVRYGMSALGEIGLGGELRNISQLPRRITELNNMGFDKILCPASFNDPSAMPKEIEIIKAQNVNEGLGYILHG